MNVFLIPAGNLKKFEDSCAKLSRKSVKVGGEEFSPIVIGYQGEGSSMKYEVYVDVDTLEIGGWMFVAKLDHSQETGTIIRALPNTGITMPDVYRHSKADCDHCNQNRRRRDTFIVMNIETGEFKQVGSTCLEMFFDKNPQDIAKRAELYSYIKDAADALEHEPTGMTDHRWVPMEAFLNHVAMTVRKHGWVSGKYAYENNVISTKTASFHSYMSNEQDLFGDDVELATDALKWARSFEHKDSLSDYEHNVLTIANSPFIQANQLGIAASIVGVYYTRVKLVEQENNSFNVDFENLISFFGNAQSKLKYPKININFPEVGDIVLSVAGDAAKFPGSVNIATPGGYGNNEFYGRITKDGKFTPSFKAPSNLKKAMSQFSTDPRKVVSEYGHRTGNCCMCSKPLKTDTSVKMGYGKTCADNWRLPYE